VSWPSSPHHPRFSWSIRIDYQQGKRSQWNVVIEDARKCSVLRAVPLYRRRQLHDTYPCRTPPTMLMSMLQYQVDDIWSMMEAGKYYSIGDLAQLSGQPKTSILDSIWFLSKYGFVQSIGQPTEIFTKTGKLSPAKSAQLLTKMVQRVTRS